MRRAFVTWLCLGVTLSAIAAADPPRTGMPVAELFEVEEAMSNFMIANDVSAGLLGIMKDGVVIYQRGFGWKDEDRTIPLRHDAVMRLASLTKPIMAAATQRLFAAGVLNPGDLVFDLGQPQGGILSEATYPPFPELVDNNFGMISVGMLYTHTSGMAPNGAGDPTYNERQIARQFTLSGDPTSSPPGRAKTLRWIMGRPLTSIPGLARLYSNAGFMTLGMVIEQVIGGNGDGNALIDFARDEVFGPLDWVPTGELVRGRTFQSDQDSREPWYDGGRCWDVFGAHNRVDCPYGSWDHESRVGQGGMVASTLLLLHLAENYFISDQGWGDPTFGAPTNGVAQNRSHNGSLDGTSTYLRARTDGIHIAVMFNKRGNDNLATVFGNQLNGMISSMNDDGFIWPTRGVDGQWIDFGNPAAGNGSYENSWSDFETAMSSAAHEATINFHGGVSSWTGTINQKIRLRAPQPGVSAMIGVPN